MEKLKSTDLLKLFYSPKEIFKKNIDIISKSPIMLACLIMGFSAALMLLNDLSDLNLYSEKVIFFGSLSLETFFGKIFFIIIETIKRSISSFFYVGISGWILFKIAGIKKSGFLEICNLIILSSIPFYLYMVFYTFYNLIFSSALSIFDSILYIISFVVLFYSYFIMVNAVNLRIEKVGRRFHLVLLGLPCCFFAVFFMFLKHFI